MTGAKNLLIVDDQADNLRVLASILSEQGYRVRKALSGITAIETAQIQPPDLILLDVNMPRMDGYAVCSALKSIPETCDIPVIFLSGIDTAPDKVRAFAVGAADYITKPFQGEEVLARVKHQLIIQWQKQQLKQEIQERKQAQAETNLLLKTIQTANATSDFEVALRTILGDLCEAIDWDYAEVWIPNTEGTSFELKQTCYDPSAQRLQQFQIESQSRALPGNDCLLGEVWAAQQPVWIADLSKASAFLRSEAATAAGLKAGFGVPILLDQEVLAILSFFKHRCSPLEPKITELVNAVAWQLGGFIQRKQAEEALKQVNRELQRLANLDGLTQIANRRCFDGILQQEWKRLKRDRMPLSLLLCDIDCFKSYNDHYGHLAGDDCLKRVAQAIEQTIKRPADLAARYGGEEFVLLLPNTTPQGATYVAEQLQAAVASLRIPHAKSLVSDFITLSIGIACQIPEAEARQEELIEAADRALYMAKHNGRNAFCCCVETCL